MEKSPKKERLSDLFTIPMTEEEAKTMHKFKDYLLNEQILYDSDKFDDGYLIRFLRARKLNLKKSAEMFANFLKWRQVNGVDEIHLFEFSEYQKVKMYYPCGFHKTDREGRPLYIDRVGMLKVDQIFNVTNPDRLLNYCIQQHEYCLNTIFPACSKENNKYIFQTFSVFDLKGLSSKHLSKKVYDFIKLTTSSSQDNYPEMLGQLFIINAGLMFKAAWAVIKAFIDEKTRKKVVTLDKKFHKKLFKFVDPQNFPKVLGGECVCEPYGCMISDKGPWNPDGNKLENIDSELLESIKKEMDITSENIGGNKDEAEEKEEVVIVNVEVEEKNVLENSPNNNNIIEVNGNNNL